MRAPTPFSTTAAALLLSLGAVAMGSGQAAGQAAPRAAATARTVTSSDEEIRRRAAERNRFYDESNYPQGIAAARAGLERAEEIGSVPDQALFLRTLAYDNWLMGNSELAIHYAHRLLRLADTLKSDADRSRAHRYLSQIYESLGDNLRSRDNADAALRFADLAADDELRTWARACQARCALRAQDFAVARRHFEAVLDYWTRTKRPANRAVALRDLGELAEAEGDIPAALGLYAQVIELSNTPMSQRIHVRALCRHAGLLRRLGRLVEARAELDRAAPIVAGLGGWEVELEFYTELALHHEKAGDFAAALAAERRASTARNVLTDTRAQVRAADLEGRLALGEKQKLIDRIQAEKNAQDALLRSQQAELMRANTMRWMGAGLAAAGLTTLGCIVLMLRARLRGQASAAALAAPASRAGQESP